MAEKPLARNPFERAILAGPDWELRRENLMEKLVERTHALTTFIHDVRSLDSASSLEETRNSLDAFYRKAVADLTPSVKAKRFYLRKIRAELCLLDEEYIKLSPIVDDTYTNPIFEELGRNIARTIQLEDRRYRMIEDPDVALLANLDETVASLLSKREAVLALAHRADEDLIKFFLSDIQKKLKINISPQSVSHVQRGCYDIQFFIGEKTMMEIKERDTLGFHFFGTPYNVILDRKEPKDLARTIHHEQIHNMIDHTSHLGHRMPADMLKTSLAYVLERDENRTDDLSEAIVSHKFQKFMHDSTATLFLDDLHNELLAELENAERLSFVQIARRKEELLLIAILGKKEPSLQPTGIQNYQRVFATAGHQVGALDTLSQLLKNKDLPPREQAIFDTFSANVKTHFVGMSHVLRESFQSIKYLPESEIAHDDLLALCVMLKPSKYRRVLPKYLDHRFGAKMMEMAKRWTVLPLVHFETIDGLRAVQHLSDTESIPEFAKQKLMNFFETFHRYDGTEIESKIGFRLRNLQKLKSYLLLVEEIGARVSLSPESFKALERKLYFEHCFQFLETDIYHGFFGLQQKIAELGPEGLLLMTFALDVYRDFFSQDIVEIEGFHPEEIDLLPHWENLKKAGFEEIANDLKTRLSSQPSSSG